MASGESSPHHDVEAASLSDLLSSSRIIFVFASATPENQGFLDEAALNRIAPGSAFLLMSRAAAVDVATLVRQASSGHLKTAVDVFSDKPVSESDLVSGGGECASFGPPDRRHPGSAA